MVQQATQRVEGRGGLRGQIREVPESGSAEIELDDGRKIQVPVSLLTRREDGSFLLSLAPEELSGSHDKSGVTEGGETAVQAGQTVTVPVAREELHVSKVQNESGRVVVHIVPQTRKEIVDVPLAEERAEIERVTVNRFVDAPEPVLQEGDVTILPIYEEVLVVQRRLMIREEVRIRRTRTVRREPQEMELRSEEVQVHRSGNPETSEPAPG